METSIGKFLRSLRFEKGEILRDMAASLGVSSAFLSAVENGKKKLPSAWLPKLKSLYSLDPIQMDLLNKAILESESTIELDVSAVSEEHRRLAVSFARQFESLDAKTMLRLTQILEKRKAD